MQNCKFEKWLNHNTKEETLVALLQFNKENKSKRRRDRERGKEEPGNTRKR